MKLCGFSIPSHSARLKQYAVFPSFPSASRWCQRGQEFQTAFAKIKARLDALGIAKTDPEALLEKNKTALRSPDASFLFPLLSGGSTVITEVFSPKHATRFRKRRVLG